MVNEDYEPTETEEEVLDVLREEWRVNPLLLRGETGHDKGTINTALSNLRAAGWVRRVTRGLYEFVEDPRRATAAEPPDRPKPTARGGESQHDPEPTERRESVDTVDSADDDLREQAEAALADLDVPGRPARIERTRRQAILYAWERLREEGEMKPRDLANDTFGRFFDDPDLGYSTASGRYAGYQLWDNCVRAVLKELPGVYQSGRTWVFREEVGDSDEDSDLYDPTDEF